MRMFGSIHIPGLGRLSANRNFERSRPDPRPRLELTLVWVGFIGTLAVILWIAFTWTALHK